MIAGSPVRRIVVCADDFGLTEAASQSIVELAGRAAISAASCVVDGPAYCRHIAGLATLRPGIALGLHLNLTDGASLQHCHSLPWWIARAYANRLPSQRTLRGEIARQLDSFEASVNGAPCFVDGHEHVHQLPHIRDALVHELVRRYGTGVAVRCTAALRPRGWKASIITRLGATSMRALLTAQRLPMNTDFAGVYDFSVAPPFGDRCAAWLSDLADGGLLMCHPERGTPATVEPNARQAEHDFLASVAWSEMRRELNITLIPFRRKQRL